MIRMQIQLTEEQDRRIRSMAEALGLSISEIVRRLVDAGIREQRPSRTELYSRAAGLIGKFADRDGAGDLAAEHDRWLDEAYE